MSPPRNNLELKQIKTFYPAPIPKKLYAKDVTLVTSTDDPYLTEDEATAMRIGLSVPMKVIQNCGHLNADSGYGKWPWVLEWVKKGTGL